MVVVVMTVIVWRGRGQKNKSENSGCLVQGKLPLPSGNSAITILP